MKVSEQNKKHALKAGFVSAGEWIMDHNKIVMPLVLVVCVLITVLVAVNANQREVSENETDDQSAMAVSEGDGEALPQEENVPPVYELEENTHPEINNMIRTYYDAQAAGDIETIISLNTYLDEIDTIRVQELSKYIDSYPVLNVYTKPGISENTYVAYVYSETLFTDVEKALPGMQTYYIGQNEDGSLFINDGTYDVTVWDYIKQVTLQDDVVDLNNRVVVQYNDMLAEDEELNEYVVYLKEKINEDVGEILAQAERPEDDLTVLDTVQASAQETSGDQAQGQESAPTVLKTVRATDVVNIRSSDSEEADKLDKAQTGQEFTLLEEKGNGWSKVRYNDKEAYIKSDYLEVVAEETVADTEQDSSGDDSQSEGQTSSGDSSDASSSEKSTGTVTVKESVRVRKSASTDAEALGTVYAGDQLELLMKQADGWTKVKYDGQTAYVKSEYVE